MGSLENGLIVGVAALLTAFGIDFIHAIFEHDPTSPFQVKKLISNLIIGGIGFGVGVAVSKK